MGQYLYSNDGSWFPLDDAVVVNVPDNIMDADEVEEFIQTAVTQDTADVKKLSDLLA